MSPGSSLQLEVPAARPEDNATGETLCTCYVCAPALYEPDQSKHTKATSYMSTRAGDYYMLGLLAHEPLQLIDAAIRSFDRNDELGPSQRRALQLWQSWAKQHLPGLQAPSEHRAWPSERDMQDLVAIFNQLFFLGAIQNVRFRWDEALKHLNSFGITTHAQWPYVGEVNVALDPVPLALQSSSRVSSMLGTLLHECTHAYVNQLGCAGSRCGEQSCKARFNPNVGNSGHGRAWQWLAEAVERVARSSLGIEVDLLRSPCFFKPAAAAVLRTCELSSPHLLSQS